MGATLLATFKMGMVVEWEQISFREFADRLWGGQHDEESRAFIDGEEIKNVRFLSYLEMPIVHVDFWDGATGSVTRADYDRIYVAVTIPKKKPASFATRSLKSLVALALTIW